MVRGRSVHRRAGGRWGRRSAAAAGAAGLLLAAAPGTAVTPGAAGIDADLGAGAARGRAIVEEHCARCHATGPAGDSPAEGAPAFRELKQSYPVDDLAEALAEGISAGHPQTPVLEFAPEDVEAILAYLRTL